MNMIRCPACRERIDVQDDELEEDVLYEKECPECFAAFKFKVVITRSFNVQIGSEK